MKNVILKPILTEKMNVATEKFNRYGFVVNKNEGCTTGKLCFWRKKLVVELM